MLERLQELVALAGMEFKPKKCPLLYLVKRKFTRDAFQIGKERIPNIREGVKSGQMVQTKVEEYSGYQESSRYG